MIPRTLIVVTATLLAAIIVIGAELPHKANNAIAQMMGNVTSGMMTRHGMMGMGPGMMGMGPGMMGMGPGMMAGNQSMTTQIMKPSQNITGSINLMNIIPQAIGSKVNVSLSDAVTTAEGSVGNGSHAVSAHIDENNGYLVYRVTVTDPSMNFSKVIVDPGNGQVLLSEQASKADMMKYEMERHHKMMSMMMGGPQQGRGMMGMGPGPGLGMMMGGERNMTMGPGMMMGGPQQGRGMMGMGPGMMGQGQGPGLGMMMGGPQQGRGMMMGPMTAEAQQTDSITSSNATSGLPTTNATVNTTSPAAVVPTSEPSATTTISMSRGSQFPNNPEFYVSTKVSVKPGQTVIWKNDDTAIHTATSGQDFSPDGKFDTSFISPGQSSKPIAMPTQPGQYPYFCTLHPWMTGTVTVG